MLLKEETEEKFKFNTSDLSRGSSKKVICRCDYCDEKCEKVWKTRVNSNKDINKDACIKCRFKKREDISLLKHGVKNSSQRRDVLDKLSDIDWESKKEGVEKLIDEGYSIDNISKKLDLPSSSLLRYVDRWELKKNDRSTSFKKALDEKYGDYRSYTINKFKKASQEKYGTDNAFQADEVKEKIKQTNLKNIGVTHHFKDKERAKENTQKGLDTRIKNGDVFIYEGKTIPELAKEREFSRSHFNGLKNKFGIESAMNMVPRESSLEKIFENFLCDNDISYKKQVKIENRYADFVCGNVAIECDGLYWHSENILDKKYHQEKRETYIKNGYTPLFFREDEIHNKLPVIQSIILNKLDRQENRIFARKCEISSCPKDFFIENHLMGKGYGKIFSLKHNGTDVAAIQIRRLRNKDYEISRFCTALHTSVVGGFSKLLKHVERNIEMDSLKTFIDLRYGKGDYLADFGFTEGKEHLSFKWTNGIDSIHRLKYRGNSGYDLGFYKIWDCGQLPFTKLY